MDFRGEKRSNETHESKTDLETKLYTKAKGQSAKLSFMGHVLMENKNGLAVDNRISQPGYHAEPDAALEMAQGLAGGRKKTIGAGKTLRPEEFNRLIKENEYYLSCSS